MDNTSKIFSYFKQFDFRGTVPDITPEIFYWIGFGLIQKVCKPENLPLEINICHDTRYSSPDFYQAVYNGILDAGGTPKALGISSSDFLYASCQVTNTAGIMITASHNPKDDNGAKIVKTGSTMLGLGQGLDKIRDFVIQKIETEKVAIENFKEVKSDSDLKAKVMDYFEKKILKIGNIESVNQLLKKQGRKIKIAVDAGNGMGGWIMKILQKMYTEVEFVDLFWELDGNFPNHPANPQEFETLKDLQEVILTDKDVEFGFAFDGDADRVFFVDEKAKVIQGDFLVAEFAKQFLKQFYKNSTSDQGKPAIVYLQPGSKVVPETIQEMDGIAVPSQQGHTHIKSNMGEFGALYGGEFSGHHYFADFGNMDSGVLAAVLMIKLIVESKRNLSEIFYKYHQKYFISDLVSFKIPAGKTFEDLKQNIYRDFPEANFSTFDGLAVYLLDWKFSMRPSGTEPVVRMILETYYQDKIEQKMNLVKKSLGL